MFEIKIDVTAPDLSAAIEKLAVALKGSVVLSPEGVQTRLSGVQAAGNPTATPASATVESVPAANTNAQQAVVQNAVNQIPAAQPVQTAQAEQQQFMNPPVTAAAPVIDLETISRAGAALIDQGKMQDILALLKKYGVMAVNKLDPSQFPAFADDLRALGADI